MEEQCRERQEGRKNSAIYINANIYSAWGPWSTEVDKARCEIQTLCFPLISPLYLWVLAEGLWTHSTAGRNRNTQREHHYPQITKARNLERSFQDRLQTIKSHISSSTSTSLPPGGCGAVGKTFLLRPCEYTHTLLYCSWQHMECAACYFLLRIAYGDMSKKHERLSWPVLACDLYHTLDTLSKLTEVCKQSVNRQKARLCVKLTWGEGGNLC